MEFVSRKPISVNEIFKGRRFRTDKYDQYEYDVLFLLPKIQVPLGELELKLIFAIPNMASDIDNFCKPFIDILQKKYQFNDKMIMRLIVEKVIVQKQKEYIGFEFKAYKK